MFSMLSWISSSETQKWSLRLPPTAVPTQETTYMCQSFDVSAYADAHVVAFEPVIANQRVMHHIVVFACPEIRKTFACAVLSLRR
jgi:dopamine beta-monooxygenase